MTKLTMLCWSGSRVGNEKRASVVLEACRDARVRMREAYAVGVKVSFCCQEESVGNLVGLRRGVFALSHHVLYYCSHIANQDVRKTGSPSAMWGGCCSLQQRGKK
jgi:hypothetical protein